VEENDICSSGLNLRGGRSKPQEKRSGKEEKNHRLLLGREGRTKTGVTPTWVGGGGGGGGEVQRKKKKGPKTGGTYQNETSRWHGRK